MKVAFHFKGNIWQFWTVSYIFFNNYKTNRQESILLPSVLTAEEYPRPIGNWTLPTKFIMVYSVVASKKRTTKKKLEMEVGKRFSNNGKQWFSLISLHVCVGFNNWMGRRKSECRALSISSLISTFNSGSPITLMPLSLLIWKLKCYYQQWSLDGRLWNIVHILPPRMDLRISHFSDEIASQECEVI